MKDFTSEAAKLLNLIDGTRIAKREDYLFVESIRARIRTGAFINQKQIFWLRDIKDRQLTQKED